MMIDRRLSVRRTSAGNIDVPLCRVQIPPDGWVHIDLQVTAVGSTGSARFRFDDIVRVSNGTTTRDGQTEATSSVAVGGETWTVSVALHDGVGTRPMTGDSDLTDRVWSPPLAVLTGQAGPSAGEVEWSVGGSMRSRGYLGPVPDAPPEEQLG